MKTTTRSSIFSVSTTSVVVAAVAAASALSACASGGIDIVENENRRLCVTNDSALESDVASAAVEFGVSYELMLAIGQTETSWWTPPEHAHDHSHLGMPERLGIMQLRMDPAGPADFALNELGIDAETLAHDRTANVRAAAAYLASTCADLGIDCWNAPLEDMRPAIEVFGAGEGDVDGGAFFADRVFNTLATGFEVVTEEGRSLVLEPHPELRTTGAAFGGTETRTQGARPDYAGATWVAANSSNYTNQSRTASDITHVTIHVVQGSYSSAINWFQNSSANVSAHYVISKTGEITQMVEEEDRGWHVGNSNGYTVGIEHEGWIADPSSFTDAMYEASADLVRDICARQNIPLDRDHIMGHVEFPNQSHTDPGTHWDWDRYMNLIVGGDPTGSLVGYVRAFDVYDETAPIVGATVQVATGQSATTNSSGFYRIDGLGFGAYDITVTASGYKPADYERNVEASGSNWASTAMEPVENCGNGTDDDRVQITEQGT